MPHIKSTFILLAVSLSVNALRAQEESPLITGDVTISITKGTIACDFVLSDMPAINNYVIRLNSGLNIRYFKDLKRGSGALYYDMDTKDSMGSDETKAYYLHENRGNPDRYIPKQLEVKYLGQYPVVADSASGWMGQDWRGNVAFNGYSIRADGLQGDWYPEIYDMDTKRLYREVRYDININCADCSVLFVNGSTPVKAKQAHFKRGQPCEMVIFCGKFEADEDHGVWLLNSGMKKADEQQLIGTAIKYQAFYEKKFGIPFKGSLTFAQTTPTADPKEFAFSFYAAPSTFNVGVGPYALQSLFDKDRGPRSKQVMAHELAHYYFGTLLNTEGVFGSIMTEGFAEYLSYVLTRSLEGDTVYRDLLSQKIAELKYLHNYQPLAMVKTESDYGNREYYLYYYAPVLFLAIQKEIGDQTMWKWLRAMVASGTNGADYMFLLTSFRKAVADETVAAMIEAKYFTSADALTDAIAEIEK